MTKLSKVALVLAMSVADSAAAHSDEPGIHHLRSTIRALAKGGSGSGNPNSGGGNGGTASTGSICAAVGSACCETKSRGKTTTSCDSSYIPTLTCMERLCVPDLTRKQQENDAAEAPKCVFTACGQAATLNTEVVYCPADEGQRCGDLASGSFCDTCSSLKCSEVGDFIPSDFDKTSSWPCFGTCVDDVSCRVSEDEVYIY